LLSLNAILALLTLLTLVIMLCIFQPFNLGVVCLILLIIYNAFILLYYGFHIRNDFSNSKELNDTSISKWIESHYRVSSYPRIMYSQSSIFISFIPIISFLFVSIVRLIYASIKLCYRKIHYIVRKTVLIR